MLTRILDPNAASLRPPAVLLDRAARDDFHDFHNYCRYRRSSSSSCSPPVSSDYSIASMLAYSFSKTVTSWSILEVGEDNTDISCMSFSSDGLHVAYATGLKVYVHPLRGEPTVFYLAGPATSIVWNPVHPSIIFCGTSVGAIFGLNINSGIVSSTIRGYDNELIFYTRCAWCMKALVMFTLVSTYPPMYVRPRLIAQHLHTDSSATSSPALHPSSSTATPLKRSLL